MNTTRRNFLQLGGATAAVAGMGASAGCMGVLGAVQPGTVKISSARFPESILLSYMSIEALRANTDLTVLDETALGGVGMNFRAVENGETTSFWLYTGGGWTTIPPKKERVISGQEQLYEAVDEKMQEVYDLAYLNRAPFNNTYILIANPEWTRKTGATTMTEFAEYVRKGNTDFTVVMGPEFRTRPDGWPGLAKHYDFEQATSKLTIRTVGASLAYQTIANGGADVGVGFSTNPNIRRYGLETIADDDTFFPPYNPSPLVNEEALETSPEMREPLDAIGPTLTLDKIVRLNGLVSLQNRDPQRVAREYLRSEGLL
ncbi:glycine/betaine ABC transporter substrate-binding protein [Halobacteriales archaeon QS_3_64_16]|nr:MAG: glycine/betaine ABC transporter substrate-binding protein [Halobacteriales archaeon QS_3_64_16]